MQHLSEETRAINVTNDSEIGGKQPMMLNPMHAGET